MIPAFYLLGSYLHIHLYEWAKGFNEQQMIEIINQFGSLEYTSYHPSRIFLIPEMALLLCLGLSLICLFKVVDCAGKINQTGSS